jgi:hypothetical protein
MSQTETLQKHFKNRKTITVDEAVTKYGIQSLSRRIVDLEVKGMKFDRQRVLDRNGRQYTRYRVL